MKLTDRQAIIDWNDHKDNHLSGTPVDLQESNLEKTRRIKNLEKDFELWASYYFPKYYEAEPASFHIKSSKRIITKEEWFEVRCWSRGLAKSVRALMEVMYLILNKKRFNVLLVSNTLDHAERLIEPFKKELESNNRIINDYGTQELLGKWTSKEFKTQKGVSFRAIGKGQNPRGTRNENYRPDVILIDDIDSDEEIRNPQRIKEGIEWIEQSLISTRSSATDKNPLIVLVCGNVIGTYCTVSELAKTADKHDVVNIINSKGLSSWTPYITLKSIGRIKAKISERAFQQEYMNNPMPQGDVFKEVHYDTCPKLSSCNQVLVYADPATSNRDVAGGSMKAVGIIAKKKNCYFLYKVWVNNMSNADFIDCLFAAHQIIKDQNVDVTKVYIENNTLQNPFYEQVLLPIIRKKSIAGNLNLPITPDIRRKPDKFTRIDGTLEPLNRLQQLFFNKKEREQPDMKRMEAQMLGVHPKAKLMDGPDMLEGGVWLLQKRNINAIHTYAVGNRPNRKY